MSILQRADAQIAKLRAAARGLGQICYTPRCFGKIAGALPKRQLAGLGQQDFDMADVDELLAEAEAAMSDETEEVEGSSARSALIRKAGAELEREMLKTAGVVEKFKANVSERAAAVKRSEEWINNPAYARDVAEAAFALSRPLDLTPVGTGKQNVKTDARSRFDFAIWLVTNSPGLNWIVHKGTAVTSKKQVIKKSLKPRAGEEPTGPEVLQRKGFDFDEAEKQTVKFRLLNEAPIWIGQLPDAAAELVAEIVMITPLRTGAKNKLIGFKMTEQDRMEAAGSDKRAREIAHAFLSFIGEWMKGEAKKAEKQAEEAFERSKLLDPQGKRVETASLTAFTGDLPEFGGTTFDIESIDLSAPTASREDLLSLGIDRQIDAASLMPLSSALAKLDDILKQAQKRYERLVKEFYRRAKGTMPESPSEDEKRLLLKDAEKKAARAVTLTTRATVPGEMRTYQLTESASLWDTQPLDLQVRLKARTPTKADPARFELSYDAEVVSMGRDARGRRIVKFDLSRFGPTALTDATGAPDLERARALFESQLDRVFRRHGGSPELREAARGLWDQIYEASGNPRPIPPEEERLQMQVNAWFRHRAKDFSREAAEQMVADGATDKNGNPLSVQAAQRQVERLNPGKRAAAWNKFLAATFSAPGEAEKMLRTTGADEKPFVVERYASGAKVEIPTALFMVMPGTTPQTLSPEPNVDAMRRVLMNITLYEQTRLLKKFKDVPAETTKVAAYLTPPSGTWPGSPAWREFVNQMRAKLSISERDSEMYEFLLEHAHWNAKLDAVSNSRQRELISDLARAAMKGAIRSAGRGLQPSDRSIPLTESIEQMVLGTPQENGSRAKDYDKSIRDMALLTYVKYALPMRNSASAIVVYFTEALTGFHSAVSRLASQKDRTQWTKQTAEWLNRNYPQLLEGSDAVQFAPIPDPKSYKTAKSTFGVVEQLSKANREINGQATYMLQQREASPLLAETPAKRHSLFDPDSPVRLTEMEKAHATSAAQREATAMRVAKLAQQDRIAPRPVVVEKVSRLWTPKGS